MLESLNMLTSESNENRKIDCKFIQNKKLLYPFVKIGILSIFFLSWKQFHWNWFKKSYLVEWVNESMIQFNAELLRNILIYLVVCSTFVKSPT